MRYLAPCVALAIAACSFDASGVGRGDDVPGDDDPAIDALGALVDAPVQPVVDALPGPIDAPPVPIDGPPGPTDGCDAPTDCGGQRCCQYGGIVTACAQSCIGGAAVCIDDFDCDGNDVCCDTVLGARECTGFCL